MDATTLKFTITAGLMIVAIVVMAIFCHRLEKKIDAMDNLKDIEK